MEKFHVFVFYIFINFYPILGLYEDQIGKFDWLQRYIGPVEKIVFDPSTSPSRRIIVSTGHNVIAALSTKSGDILWRHILEPGDSGRIGLLSVHDHYVFALTGNLLRTWDAISSAIKEEVRMDFPSSWPQSLSRLFEFSKSNEILYCIKLFEGKIGVDSYDTGNGEMIAQTTADTNWLNEWTKCIAMAGNLICLDLPSGFLHFIALDSLNEPNTPYPLKTFGIESDDKDISSMELKPVNGQGNYIWLKVGTETKIVHVHDDGLHLVQDVSTSKVAAVEGDNLITAKLTGPKTFKMQVFDLTNDEEITEEELSVTLPHHSGDITELALHRFRKKGGVNGVKVLFTCSDHSIHLASSTGITWSREESLSLILSAESVDLPLKDAEESFQGQMSDRAGPIVSFIHRMKSQALHVSLWLSSFAYSDLAASDVPLTRDKFNLRKLIVVTTKSGKLFGIDSWTGEIVWMTLVPDLIPFKSGKPLLFTQRTSSHFPRLPQCVLVGRNKNNGFVRLFVFNPLTGEGINDDGGIVDFQFNVLQVSVLEQQDVDYIRPILFVDTNLGVSVYPLNGEVLLLQHKNSIYINLALPKSSFLKGYTLRHSQKGALHLTEVWRLSFETNGNIIGIYGKSAADRVHSPGRVLADRSVLYKYANPNLAVVATYGQDYQSKYTLGVHLVDLVTGSVLESVTHKRVAGPFHFVHAENWVVYTCYNDKFRRNEVITLELFEGLVQSNASFATSFGARATPPIVEKQAFIIPQGVQAASHTITEKGITTKYILFALKTGNVLQLSKWFLDPRRPMSHSGPREEGLVPYMPELPLPPQEMINHNNSLPIVEGIYTATTGLESTCLVFIYGLDLFYTRIFPSKNFDVLKDDFDHWLIIGVLLSLTTAAIVTKRLASRKALKQAWK